MDYTGYPVIQFGSFRYTTRDDAPTPRNTPRRKNNNTPSSETNTPISQRDTPNRNTPRRNTPRSQRRNGSPRSPKGTNFTNIQEQLEHATVKYEEVLKKYMRTPCNRITRQQEDDLWAWQLFAEVILPMFKFVDEE